MLTKRIKKIFYTCAVSIILMISSGTIAYAQNTMANSHISVHNIVTLKKLLRETSFLCDSLCAGREAGTRGGVEAAFWIHNQFKRIGLLPIGKGYGKKVYVGNGKFGRNIVGMLPATGEKSSDRYVIVGAHYDHLGMIGERMFPGADANASGTVAMLNIAEMLNASHKLGTKHGCNVIFVAFDGMEKEMSGSYSFWRMLCNNELIDPLSGKVITKEKIAFMMNIDQIGCSMSPLASGRKDYIIMLGNHSLPRIKRDMLHICNRMFAIDLEIDLTYYNSPNFTEMFYRLSDQRVFVDNNIPAVLFTSGITMNNNKTYDTPESLDLEVFRKRIFLMYHWLDKMIK